MTVCTANVPRHRIPLGYITVGSRLATWCPLQPARRAVRSSVSAAIAHAGSSSSAKKASRVRFSGDQSIRRSHSISAERCSPDPAEPGPRRGGHPGTPTGLLFGGAPTGYFYGNPDGVTSTGTPMALLPYRHPRRPEPPTGLLLPEPRGPRRGYFGTGTPTGLLQRSSTSAPGLVVEARPYGPALLREPLVRSVCRS
jgi:hypothetical protein